MLHMLITVSIDRKLLPARPHAGQAVVQFAVDPRDGREFAVKFFLQEKAFRREAALYAACFPSLRRHLSPSLLSLLSASTSESSPAYVDQVFSSLGHVGEQATACESSKTLSSSVAPTSVDSRSGRAETAQAEAGGDRVRMQSSSAVSIRPQRQRKDATSEPGQRHDTVSTPRGGGDAPEVMAALHTAAGEHLWDTCGSFQPMPDTAAKFLPQVEVVCEDPEDPLGRPLPPCIVMERGESLQDWSDRAEPDLFTSLAVCFPPDGNDIHFGPASVTVPTTHWYTLPYQYEVVTTMVALPLTSESLLVTNLLPSAEQKPCKPCKLINHVCMQERGGRCCRCCPMSRLGWRSCMRRGTCTATSSPPTSCGCRVRTAGLSSILAAWPAMGTLRRSVSHSLTPLRRWSEPMKRASHGWRHGRRWMHGRSG